MAYTPASQQSPSGKRAAPGTTGNSKKNIASLMIKTGTHSKPPTDYDPKTGRYYWIKGHKPLEGPYTTEAMTARHSLAFMLQQPFKKGYDVGGLQQRLIRSGFLGDTGYIKGVYDSATREAYQQALMEAALADSTIDDVFGRRISAGGVVGGGGGGARGPVFHFQPPDPQAIIEAFKNVGTNLLGRAPTDAEAQQFASDFTSQLEAASRSDFNTAQAGGVATPEPNLQARATERLKQLHPDEADTYKKFGLVNETMRQLGIIGGGGNG